MKKISRKLLALTLCICMAISCIPITAYATGALPEVEINETATVDQGLTEPYIIEEIESKRDANTKHFLLSDGSYMAAQYDIPVHFKDESGVWEQYDNSLQEDSSLADELANKKSDTAVTLSKKAKQSKLASVNVDGYEISWGYEKVNNSPISYVNDTKDSLSTELVNIVEEAWYYDVYNGVDLQYFILPYGIKENIVLENKNSQKEFYVNYKIDSLSAVETDSQTIELRNADGAVVYTIKAPIMTDAAENTSDAVSIEIVKTTGNGIRVKISASEEWLNSDDRIYPVTVDPWVETKQSTNAIDSASLFSYSTPSSTYPHGSLYVGRESTTYGRTVSVVKTQLPTLSAGDMVVGGELALRQRGYSGNSDVQVNVSKINTSWSQSDFVYSGTIEAEYSFISSKNSKIEDFNIANGTTLTDANAGKLTYWDITSVVKGWYNGEANNGVMLWSNEPDEFKYVRYVRAADSGNYTNTSYPVIFISYVNNNGLEGHWTYHDVGVTNRGTAYVNDYTGNLVVTENIFNTTGNRMPMNISLVYNLRNYNAKFKYGASAGYGFMFNFQQRIDAVTDSSLIEKGYKYIYTDSDGTEHYFRQKEGSTTEWVDEEGLELVIKETGDTGAGLYLHYKDGTVSHFYSTSDSGLIFHTKDTYGNQIRYYSTTPFGTEYGRLVTSIEDGAGRTVTITYELYNNVPRVKSITDNENRVYTFAYDTSDQTLLKSITYPDQTVTTYSYNSKRLSSVADSLGYKTDFTFIGDGNITKTQIKTVTSYSVEDGINYLIGKLTFAYNKDNTTTVTDYDGISQLYQFDNFGRTVSIRYPDGTISNASYHSTSGGNQNGSAAPNSVVNNNKVISQSTSEKYVKNYVANSNAERDSDFYVSNWAGSAGDAFSYDSSVKYLGNRSLKICNNEDDEYFNFYGQQIFTTDFADKDYTFSAYVKTNNVVTSSKYGAGLILQFYDSSGASLNITYSKYYLTGTNDWMRISLSGHAPAGTVEVRVYCGLRDASGTAWFDCLQLEKNTVMNDYNLVENSDFSKVSVWNAVNFATGDSYTGNGKVTVTGGATDNKYIYQYIPVNKADVCFNIFGTIDGTLAAQKDGRLTGLEVCIIYSDGTSTEYPNKQFNPATSSEQSISFTVKPKRKGVVVEKIGIFYIVRNTANTTNLKNVMVTFDESGTSYTYDSKGNLISSADNAARNQAYEYNDADELTKYTNAKNESYKYIYDSANEHKLNAVRSNQLGNGYTYSYDSYGNVINTKMGVVSEDGILNTNLEHIKSSQTYNSTGNYVTSETDTRGNTTTYNVSAANGLIYNITTPATVNGTDTTVTTNYSYNHITRLPSMIMSGNSDVMYTYDAKRRVKTIEANGNVYTFNYDVYGNRTSVQIGSETLITYEYETARKGLVTRCVYANGDYVNYEYDEFDRLIRKDIDDISEYKVYYNHKGQIARTYDNSNRTTIDYVYDLADRLTLKIVNNMYGDVDTFSYKYDILNRVTEYTETVDGVKVTYTYDYDEDSLLWAKGQHNFDYGYDYDELNRLVEKSTELDYEKIVKTVYTYEEGTTLVSSEKLYYNNQLIQTLAYTYDDWGNIATITKDGTLLESYTYDRHNQLKTVTKGTDVYEYSYDNAGNIQNVKLNGTVTDTYTYGDSNWDDKLTAYNGETITYDDLGNPIQYRDGLSFSWVKGRTALEIIVDDGNAEILIGTDSDGHRAFKNLFGYGSGWSNTSCTFKYDGDLLISQSGTTGTLRFLYDENGSPEGFTHNGASYYYLKNIQGDIIGIIDINGDILAKYTYDVWGKILSITDGNGNDVSANKNHIANINPIRYRGYYYDTETGLYYVSSRYYDPVTGRFVNADGYVSTGQGLTGYNMFAYCGNNPVNRKDPSGQGWITALIITAVVVTVATVVVKIVADNKIDKSGANDAEKALAKKDYFAAYQVNQARKIADEYTAKTYNVDPTKQDNNQPNAYRHAMWNAVMTDKIGEEKAKKFADAHELVENYDLWKENCQMDLHNNELGRRIAIEYAGQGYDVFSQKIQEAINNDEAIVLRWDEGF